MKGEGAMTSLFEKIELQCYLNDTTEDLWSSISPVMNYIPF